jgi:hypothetical protein
MMIAKETSELAMRDFILSSGSNFETALLVHHGFYRVREKLISELAERVATTLTGEQGWEVITNTLASLPTDQYSMLTWAPKEWRTYGWGIALNAEAYNTKSMIFGLYATAKDNKDRAQGGTALQYPAMPDEDRAQLAEALTPMLRTFGHADRSSLWWPRYTFLPREVRDWDGRDTMCKIYYATRGGKRDLVAGKAMDEYLVDSFRAARSAIMPILASKAIVPVQE